MAASQLLGAIMHGNSNALVKPIVFLGYSSEKQALANAIREQLTTCDVISWEHFEPGSATLESLLQKCEAVDFAVLLMSEDDVLESRNQRWWVPRDNLVLELGLFLGALGRFRTFAVTPQSEFRRDSDYKRPSDLYGIISVPYRDDLSDPLIATASACALIVAQIGKLGLHPRRQSALDLADIQKIYGNDPNINLVYSKLRLDDRVVRAIQESETLSDSEKQRLITHSLTPTDNLFLPSLEFRSEKVACVCEVRATDYLASALSQFNSFALKIVDHHALSPLEEFYDQSFVSIGAFSNRMTRILLKDVRDLIAINIEGKDDLFFECGDVRLTPQRNENSDFGAIIGMRTRQGKSWIACAGLGEYGTAGSAYFLARYWREIAAELNSTTARFAWIVQVRNQSDSSAEKYQFATTSNDWKHFSELELANKPKAELTFC